MSRPLRIQQPGLTYHVMARGNGRMQLFFEALDYRKCLWILGDACERYAMECLYYSLMPNHYHVALRTREANLSQGIHCLNGTFATWWNRRHDHVGHVFQGRYRAQIVESGQYVFNLARYILRNPLRAGLVESLPQWPWSSYHALCGREAPPPFLNVDLALRVVGDGTLRERQDAFRAFVDVEDVEGDAAIQALVRGDARVIGSDAFKARFGALAASASREIPRRERHLAEPTLEQYLQQHVGRVPLPQVIRDARLVGHSITAIAACLGLSVRSVKRQSAACAAGLTADSHVAS